MENKPESNIKLTIPENTPFEHKEAEDDDCGLPESPIYSNYNKYLWNRPANGFYPDKSRQNSNKPK